MSEDRFESNSEGGPQHSEAGASAELPGKLLASKRLELNWSVEDVAHALHLAPRQIQAIEENNYAALPGMAIARGFVRSYAKLLKLDPAPLLQNIAIETDARTENVPMRRALPAEPFYPNRALNLGTSSRSWVRGAIWLVLILLVALLVAWKAGWMPPSWIAEAERLMSESAISDKAEQSKAEFSNVVPSAPQATPAIMAVAPTVHVDPSQKDSDSVANPKTSGIADAQTVAPKEQVSAQAASNIESKDTLVLKLREDSWIEIRSAGNKVLLSRLAKAGESETIPVNGPIKLIIGNAAGVDAQLRGVPVELNASAKNNVARLTVN